MSNQGFRFERHLKLWEEQNRLVKRLIIVALLFTILLTVKVLLPFSKNVDKRNDLLNQKARLTQEKKDSEFELGILPQLEKAFLAAQRVVEDRPWFAIKDELILELHNIRDNSPDEGTPEQYKAAADKAIRTIGNLIIKEVVEPLENALPDNKKGKEIFKELFSILKNYRSDIKKWENEHIKKNWYRTYEEKHQTMIDLTDSLHAKTSQLSDLVIERIDKIKVKKNVLETNIPQTESKLSSCDDENKRLRKTMQTLLPESIQNVLEVYHMVQLFPLIMLFIAVYIVTMAVILTRHYEFVAKSIDLSEVERNDLAISSLWTLTRRGRIGTSLTLGTYFVILLTAWTFFEWGYGLFVKWLVLDSPKALIKEDLVVNGFRWFCRLLWIAMILPVLLTYKKRKTKHIHKK